MARIGIVITASSFVYLTVAVIEWTAHGPQATALVTTCEYRTSGK
jgi:hypothetical protein